MWGLQKGEYTEVRIYFSMQWEVIKSINNQGYTLHLRNRKQIKAIEILFIDLIHMKHNNNLIKNLRSNIAARYRPQTLDGQQGKALRSWRYEFFFP